MLNKANLLDREANAWSSLQGLMAVLALPATRREDGVYRKRQVEVEISRNAWVQIDSMAVEPDRLVFWYGTNGRRVEYVFERSEGAPRWRVEAATKLVFVLGEESHA